MEFSIQKFRCYQHAIVLNLRFIFSLVISKNTAPSSIHFIQMHQSLSCRDIRMETILLNTIKSSTTVIASLNLKENTKSFCRIFWCKK